MGTFQLFFQTKYERRSTRNKGKNKGSEIEIMEGKSELKKKYLKRKKQVKGELKSQKSLF